MKLLLTKMFTFWLNIIKSIVLYFKISWRHLYMTMSQREG